MSRYKFCKLHIHHFLSFDDATLDLSDRGYCLINGINKNPKDAARSNGSGKSTICNALSFALIGETISGLKSNLANIYFDDGCYVELEFYVDNIKYNLLRSRDDKTYGTNLKIYVNDEDKSGKGIRESQAVLDELLPDITRELIGSVILLGQGLPDRFTANSPSGRKEVLEHLSKSDFMIQDLKRRLEDRSKVISDAIRVVEDSEVKNDTEKNIVITYLDQAKQKLESLSKVTDFNSIIATKKELLSNLKKKFDSNDLILKEAEQKEAELNKLLLEQTNLKSERLANVYKQFVDYDKELSKMKWDFERQVTTLEQEIKSLKEIRDICPTCGQKIPNVIKPDTKQKEIDLERVKNSLTNTLADIKDNNEEYNNVKVKIETEFNTATASAKSSLQEIAGKKIQYSNTSTSLEINRLNGEIIALEKDRDSHDKEVKECENKINEYSERILQADNTAKDLLDKKLNLREHQEVLSKMNTYIKRDFRGILLSNSIDYINKRAKDYASKIFNTDEVEFKLDGNNIDISFCKKDYENLSGGEKQRIDLITQFAIRDMLAKQVGFSSNILFLDEITDSLDKESCDKVIDFVTNEFKDIESMFIISHHADLDIPYDSEITVCKDIMGVSRIQ